MMTSPALSQDTNFSIYEIQSGSHVNGLLMTMEFSGPLFGFVENLGSKKK